MLDFQIGELATRLRALLGVRGRMPLGLDEHVIPTILTADASGPPWRRAGYGFTASAMFTTAAVNNGATIALVPTAPSGTFVITGYQLAALSFVTATPTVAVVDNAAALWFSPAGAPAQVAPTGSFAISTEQYETPPNFVVGAYEVPLNILTGRTIGAFAAAQGDNLIAVDRRVALNSDGGWCPCEIVIRAAGGAVSALVATTLPLASATDTARVLLNVRGNFYPGV